MAASMSSSPGCAAPDAPQRSYETFGKNGPSTALPRLTASSAHRSRLHHTGLPSKRTTRSASQSSQRCPSAGTRSGSCPSRSLSSQLISLSSLRELRNSLDTLRSETEKQAGFHLQLAQQVRNDLEGPANAFVARQAQHRKVVQSAIEKQFKVKQAQETHVNKAREKYEADCIRINSFTAQSTLVQGKDLESINRKLERTQQTVKTNERDFANFSRALNDTVGKWEHDWKVFCDSCQDMEEDRMEFLKDIVWAYANAVSIVCVSDDEVSRLSISHESDISLITDHDAAVLRTPPPRSRAV